LAGLLAAGGCVPFSATAGNELEAGSAGRGLPIVYTALTLSAVLVVGLFGIKQRSLARQVDRRRRRAERRARKEIALRTQIRESEERYRFLLESVEDYANFMLDASGRVASWNAGAERLLGYGEAEVLGRHVSLFYAPQERIAGHPAEVLRRAAAGGRYREEGWRVRKDGSRIWADVTTKALWDERGHLLGFAKVTRDLTERRRAEESLRVLAETGTTLAASLDYRQILTGLAQLMVPVLADWSVLDMLEDGEVQRVEVAVADPEWADLARRYREYPPDLADGRSPAARVLRTGRPELIPEVTPGFLEAATRSPEHNRLALDLKMRSVIIVPLVVRGQILGALSLIMAESGRRFCSDDLALASDIARRAALAVENVRLLELAREARGEAERRAREEAALRRAATAIGAAFTIEEMVEQIAQSALMATNADGALVERVGQGLHEVEVVAVAGERKLPLGARMTYAGSLAQSVIERGDSELIPCLSETTGRVSPELLHTCSICAVLAVPLIDAGEAIGALILLREPEKNAFRPDEVARARTFADLAALAFRKVRLLEDSERRSIELQQVMESRSRLMRGFSHDVKNPLGAADGFLQLLEEGIMGDIDERQREAMGRARRAIAEALKLIDELLAFARAEAGELTVESRALDLRATVREVVEGYRAGAEAKGLAISGRVPEHFPIIDSDASRVRQILGNLLTNAIKYTPAGEVRVELELGRGGAISRSGSWAAVAVVDSGPGISPAEQSELFQEFSRLDSAASMAGAGIGLAISRRIAHALGGDITVASEMGRGSTFTLWLPIMKAVPPGEPGG
jgi:PAS domain S-box-containing protein